MCHKHNFSKLQLLDNSIQFSDLILGRIWIVRGFFGSSPSQKIKRHNTARRKIGNKAIMQMKIVWKAVHQNDAWFFTRVLFDINAMLPPVYDWLDKIHLVLSETLLINGLLARK